MIGCPYVDEERWLLGLASIRMGWFAAAASVRSVREWLSDDLRSQFPALSRAITVPLTDRR
jgi:hypothetical protein